MTMLTRRSFALGAASLPFLRYALNSRLAHAEAASAGKTYALTELKLPPKYPADFKHWDYVRPDAPVGGSLRLAAFGTFDSLNSLITRGTPGAGLNLIYDALIAANADELTAYYAYVAHSIEHAEDNSWMVFKMRPEAHFHDGTPMTAHDVVFTHETLRDKGAPRLRIRFYADVDRIEALDDHTVRFSAKSLQNPNLLMAIATFPILPKHWWQNRTFDDPVLDPPLGSSTYKIKSVDPGRSIVYERVPDFWGRSLPQNVGLGNFDEIGYDYYRDNNVMYEALKAGAFDFIEVTQSQEWATGFTNVPAVKDGRLILEALPSDEPANFAGFWFNTRRPQFRDVRVREALAQFYDFETARRTIHYNLFKRVDSYFPNTDFAATGVPEGRELEILNQFKGKIPDKIFTEPFRLPTTDGSGNIRANLARARDLFSQAGWTVQNGTLVETATGQPMAFEIMFTSQPTEKIVNAFIANLARGGIKATARLVDVPQYINRMDNYDFDMSVTALNIFYPPGQELRGAWKSEAADEKGNENMTGVKDPVIDALVEIAVAASTWDEKVAACRALDRYLLWNWLTIPTFYDDTHRLAYWKMFGRPATRPKYGVGFPDSWWFDGSDPRSLRGQRR